MAKLKPISFSYYREWSEEATLNAMDKSFLLLKELGLRLPSGMTDEGRELAILIIEDAITILQKLAQR